MKHFLASIKEWLKAFFWAILLIICLQAFVGEILTISSSSMQNTLMPGDAVYVSKLSYGPRLPITPLSLPFSHQTFESGKRSFVDWISLPYFRIGHVTSIERNDIIVFNYPVESEFPVDQRTKYVKRCVGLPGDIVFIEEKKLFVNVVEENTEGKLYNYYLKTKTELSTEDLKSFKIKESGRIHSELEWNVSISSKLADSLKKLDEVVALNEVKEKKGMVDAYVFPYSDEYDWNKDYFGPVKIPVKGDTINLTQQNIDLYINMISIYEGHQLEINEGEIVIDGVISNSFVPEMNYFFVLGDNRDNSADSRFWGFLPENHIIGKVNRIVFSLDPEKPWYQKFRTDRFFKKAE